MSESARDNPTTGKKGTSLTDRAGRGYVWMLGQTAANQVLNFGGQIALGYLIFKEDFGLYATVQALAMGAAQAHKVGLRAILIRRQARFHLWANPAFWVALTLGIVSMLVLFAVTPFAAAIFDEPKITPLIPVIALAMPFISIASIPEARIQAQMRFRLLAASRFLQVSGLLALTVLLAALDFGVWSFVIPRPIIAFLRATWLLAVTRPPLRSRPQANRWRFMLRDSWRLAVGNWANYVITQMDYMILAAIHSSNVVGLYFYAFGLSQRAFVVLTMNLRDVLFSRAQHAPERPGATGRCLPSRVADAHDDRRSVLLPSGGARGTGGQSRPRRDEVGRPGHTRSDSLARHVVSDGRGNRHSRSSKRKDDSAPSA